MPIAELRDLSEDLACDYLDDAGCSKNGDALVEPVSIDDDGDDDDAAALVLVRRRRSAS